jgi:hypothetical protein
MNPWRRLITAVMPAAVVGLAACSTSTSTTAFDPAALSQSTDAVINTMDSSQVQQSMDVMGSKMNDSALAAVAQVATLPRVALSGGFTAWTQQQLQALKAPGPGRSVAAPQGVILQNLRGLTFTYNVDLHVYLPDTSLHGAPSTGVRFILYAVNPLTQTVVTNPLTPIGYADILDESTSGTNQVELQAYVTGTSTPLIDYTASASVTLTNGSPSEGTATAAGYISNGTREVDFHLTQSFSTTTGLSVDYQLSVANTDVSIEFQASVTLAQVASVTVTVHTNGNTDVITAGGTLGADITGQITHNGTVEINIGGTEDNPTFTDASGNPITGTQALELRRVALFVGEVTIHVDALLAPAHALFLLPF